MVRTKVFVGNLSFTTKENELAKEFEVAGKVISANIITRGPRSLGYGFVEMENEADANNAVKLLDKKEIDGRPINVEVAKLRDETAPAQGQGQELTLKEELPEEELLEDEDPDEDEEDSELKDKMDKDNKDNNKEDNRDNKEDNKDNNKINKELQEEPDEETQQEDNPPEEPELPELPDPLDPRERRPEHPLPLLCLLLTCLLLLRTKDSPRFLRTLHSHTRLLMSSRRKPESQRDLDSSSSTPKPINRRLLMLLTTRTLKDDLLLLRSL